MTGRTPKEQGRGRAREGGGGVETQGEEKGRIEVGREDGRGEGGELFKGVLGGRGGYLQGEET